MPLSYSKYERTYVMYKSKYLFMSTFYNPKFPSSNSAKIVQQNNDYIYICRTQNDLNP